ncbi:MAG TPA: ABC transporter substrate-binding protein [Candidatus Binatia bacterium]|nr:ABC transporter substrate-binding protein [Candidatus Binatia bacterium]
MRKFFGFTLSPSRFALSLLCALLLAHCFSASAQQPAKIPRIGYAASGGDINNPGFIVGAFRRGLRDLGYIEGKNIIVEYRYPGEDPRDLGFIAELIQLKVDVLVSSSAAAIRAAKQATKTIPIVIMASFDPVEAGIVESLARPGGNITGVARLTHELTGKRLELFKEAVPKISRVGIFADRESVSWKHYERAAGTLNLSLETLEVNHSNPDLEAVFRSAAKAHVNAIIMSSNRSINRYAKQIVALALKNRLPSMFEISTRVEAGGLMSYSADDAALFKRAAVYVDKILKGAKPADLPVEQPTKFEFVINLKTAKQIGLTIPPNVLARADRVIR